MEKISPILPEWIARQASLGPNVILDIDKNEHYLNDQFWKMLTATCPLIFEKYLLVLHPFWINYEIKQLYKNGVPVNEEVKNNYEKYYQPFNWIDFFKKYKRDFSLETAPKIKEEISKEIQDKNGFDFVWFPAEGDIENYQLEIITRELRNLYGDIEVNYYYCLLKTQTWEEEIIYKGKLSERSELAKLEDIKDNPTAIFPDSKDWCIVSDFDLDFSFVGGSKELIDGILSSNSDDFYEIKPRYYERKIGWFDKFFKLFK